jgi:hypothetical protein
VFVLMGVLVGGCTAPGRAPAAEAAQTGPEDGYRDRGAVGISTFGTVFSVVSLRGLTT